jgi:hypothetical protein
VPATVLAAARKRAPAAGLSAVPTVRAGTVEGTLSGRDAAAEPVAAGTLLHAPVTDGVREMSDGEEFATTARPEDTLLCGDTLKDHEHGEPGADDLS